MIHQVVIESFYLLFLGVTKNLIQKFVGDGKRPSMCGDSNTIKYSISKKIKEIINYQPPEFQRRLRPIEFFWQFKGHEFRCFLLFTGPFILLNSIPQPNYNNFLLLHFAIRILHDSTLCLSHNQIAKKNVENIRSELRGNLWR